eukprot:3765399-Rhodomonas_salina.1
MKAEAERVLLRAVGDRDRSETKGGRGSERASARERDGVGERDVRRERDKTERQREGGREGEGEGRGSGRAGGRSSRGRQAR